VDVAGAADGDKAVQELLLALRSGNHVLDGLLHAETASFLTRLGRDRDAADELRSARDFLAQAVLLDPGNETARRQSDNLERSWWTIHGNLALEKRDFALAERHFRRALEFRALRQDDVAWTKLAEARNRAKRYDLAIEAACEALRRFPDSVEARAERAFARSGLKDIEGASSDYVIAAVAARSDPVDMRQRFLVAELDALPAHVRADAERAWAADPRQRNTVSLAKAAWLVPEMEGEQLSSGTLAEMRVRHALTAELPGKLTRRLALRIAAADTPAADFRAALRPVPDPDIERSTQLKETIERLRMGAPEGAADDLDELLWESDAKVCRAAAEALVDLDPGRAAELLADPKSLSNASLLDLIQVAARTTDRRLVRPLIRLLASDDYVVRKTAHVSLFALTRGEAPRLATLDVTDGRATEYRRAILDVEAWWAREEDRFELR
jgi:tetratricopeptide (TPR) repeat protein